jgi:hypothetical protein
MLQKHTGYWRATHRRQAIVSRLKTIVSTQIITGVSSWLPCCGRIIRIGAKKARKVMAVTGTKAGFFHLLRSIRMAMALVHSPQLKARLAHPGSVNRAADVMEVISGGLVAAAAGGADVCGVMRSLNSQLRRPLLLRPPARSQPVLKNLRAAPR